MQHIYQTYAAKTLRMMNKIFDSKNYDFNT